MSSQGFEYNLALFVMALALVAYGAGRWSLDYWIARARRKETGAQDLTTGRPAIA
jgi:uncharacterized membrane protein YphA (DoxX/SURF4 family)